MTCKKWSELAHMAQGLANPTIGDGTIHKIPILLGNQVERRLCHLSHLITVSGWLEPVLTHWSSLKIISLRAHPLALFLETLCPIITLTYTKCSRFIIHKPSLGLMHKTPPYVFAFLSYVFYNKVPQIGCLK